MPKTKMASQRRTRYSAAEVLEEIFADPDSDLEEECSTEEDESEINSDSDFEGVEVNQEQSESSESSETEQQAPRAEVSQSSTTNPRRGGATGRPRGTTRSNKKQMQATLELQWKSVDGEPQIPAFTANSGIQVQLPDDAVPGDFLDLFLTDEFVDILVTQTNLYAEQYKRDNPNLPRNSRANLWKETTRNEMKKFLALTLLMGIVKKPEISDYWSLNPLLKGSIFNKVMTRNRYQSILQFLHFADNSTYNPNTHDKLYKVRPVIEYLVSKFKSVYIPDAHISVDEELLLWKGRLAFKQYIPLKRARFGIKLFSLCETSGYLWNSFVYLGKEPRGLANNNNLVKELGLSGAVIPRLMDSLLGKGYKLFVDNWYTSEELFRYLQRNQTAACGTARRNRLKLPSSLKDPKLKKGEHFFRTKDNILAVRLQDKKEVYFLSTIHKANVVDTGKRDRHGNNVRKLQVVHDYNKYMGGVDRNDEMLGTYSCVRKSMKWTKKVAFHFIEEGVLNAHILYKKSGGNKTLLKFKLECINSLLAAAGAEPAASDVSNRFSGRHFPELIPPTAKKDNPQKRCIICWEQGRRKESRYQCGYCVNHPGLCAAPCFCIYHTE